MPTKGPIVVIEDDLDDQEIFQHILDNLDVRNKTLFFKDGNEALDFLRTTNEQPFLIFCDINLPKMNGIEVRNEIERDHYLKSKSIPFVFLTTSTNPETVKEAYSLSVQGFFIKPTSFDAFQQTIKEIIRYWAKSKHPNSVDLKRQFY